jgi:acyl-homoserine lactone acylase PvdQ
VPPESYGTSVSRWLVMLCVLCPFCVLVGCRRAPPPALPPLVAQTSGTIAIPSLSAPVRIVRDRWGVPHIYAQSQADLFVAQGFVQAEDRLFQMDLWRRSAQGRLSEVLGPNFVERDAMTRRMQYRGDLDQEWASYGPDAKAIAAAFVRGVNAWVAMARERPPEEFVLAGWKPEEWTPRDLVNRTDAFVSSGDAIAEIFRARLVAAVGARRADLLIPGDRTTRVASGLDVSTVHYLVADAIRRVGTPPFFLGLARPVTVRLPLDTARGRPPDRDPARKFDHPSLRYLIHLNAPGWNVIGATAPWLPGVAVGHNDRIAWTAEPFEADTQDVYVEKVNPANPHQVDDNGRWVDTEIVNEPIVIRGSPKPFVFESERTRHGVIVASDRARNLAFALRWSGSEPGTAGELASPALDRAASWPEFRAALTRWKMPARRFAYADTGGRRESQLAALIPARRGSNGAMPSPGWTGTNEWTGWQNLGSGPTASTTTVAPAIDRLARTDPNRADALLQTLAAAMTSANALTVQRALIADAVAGMLRESAPAPRAVLFAHPLGITEAARRRFNIGPLTPRRSDPPPFAVACDAADWDRASGMNAPGQSGSPGSAHFADLASRWAAGASIPLAFSDRAVQESAETTLTLTPVP